MNKPSRAPARFLDRKSAPHLVTLIALSTFAPLSMNIFIPSLPRIAEHFATDYVIAQLAVSLYLIANAFLQLIIGPLSDRFGRRPIALIFLSVALAASFLALFAPTIETFLGARIVQGTAIAGLVVCRAAIRDMVGMDKAASMLGYVTMCVALGPMLAPIAGGILEEWYGWQASFWLLCLIGAFILALVWADMGETLHQRQAGPLTQMSGYGELFRSRRFWGYVATAALTSGAYFAFVGGAPYLASVHYGMGPTGYALYFAIMSSGYIFGNFMSGRYALRIGVNRMLLIGGTIGCVGLLVAIILQLVVPPHPMTFFLPATAVGISNGMILPSSIAGSLSVRPHLAGTAAGLGGFIQIGGGAVLSVAGGAVVTPHSGAVPLLLVMFASVLTAMAMTLYVIAVARKAGDVPVKREALDYE